MDKKQAEEFTETVDQFGTAWYRQVLWAGENGIPKALGYNSLEEWVHGRLGGYRKYAVKDRRRIVMELTQEGKNQRQIAATLGVTQATVSGDLGSDKNLSKSVKKPKETGVESDKNLSPKANGESAEASASKTNPLTVKPTTKEPLRNAHPETEEPPPNSNMVNRLQSLTGEIEWYTPEKYLTSVRKVLGVIDLDPASSDVAQELVRATTYYCKEQDGLAQSWIGKVFLNPPYAMPTIKQFVIHMVEQYKNGNMKEGILLTNAATDTSWYDIAYGSAEAKCDTTGRISFLGNVQGSFQECTAPACGQTFFYFGKHRDKFSKEFRQYGRISIELQIP
jgi:predicted transcriptional regulator